jgi:hypothetical protein
MTDKLDGKPWASNHDFLVVTCGCVIISLMTLRYLHPAAAAVVIVVMLSGYLISVFGHGLRRSSTPFSPTTGQPGDCQ